MASVNSSNPDVAEQASGQALKRDNLSQEATAAASAGARSSAGRTLIERAKYKAGVKNSLKNTPK